MQRRGITKVRNEAHIIEDTLDRWAEFCPDGIHVYDDCSSDDTAHICRAHPAVVEVISSDLFDSDRERAEWFNRQALLNSARRFMQEGSDWICYFDADEHPVDIDMDRVDWEQAEALSLDLYDVHITPEDVDGLYLDRRWVDSQFRRIPFFFRLQSWSGYAQPDQRIMTYQQIRGPRCFPVGLCKHYGKGLSVGHWEKKCDYYANTFGPKYADKWRLRRGKAIKTDYKSDFGEPLVDFERIRIEYSRLCAVG